MLRPDWKDVITLAQGLRGTGNHETPERREAGRVAHGTPRPRPTANLRNQIGLNPASPACAITKRLPRGMASECYRTSQSCFPAKISPGRACPALACAA